MTTKKNKGYLIWDVEQDERCKKSLVNCAKKKHAKYVKQFVCGGLGKPWKALWTFLSPAKVYRDLFLLKIKKLWNI